jgi:hypothetical protein
MGGGGEPCSRGSAPKRRAKPAPPPPNPPLIPPHPNPAHMPLPTPTPPIKPQKVVLPPTVPATAAYLHSDGAYLLDNGSLSILWLGRGLDPGLAAQVGGGVLGLGACAFGLRGWRGRGAERAVALTRAWPRRWGLGGGVGMPRSWQAAADPDPAGSHGRARAHAARPKKNACAPAHPDQSNPPPT